VPVEIAMIGLPGLTEIRSVNMPQLSLVTLIFTDATPVYFARQLVMERLPDAQARMPPGVIPTLGPVSTGLGEVYQYTLQKDDDGNRALSVEELTERRTIQDWVVRPLLRAIPGVAEINSQGGYVKQYQALVNPERLYHYRANVHDVFNALAANNANFGGGILPHFADQHLIRGIGLVRDLEDIRSIVLKSQDGVPVFIRDVADVTFGHEVRQGALLKDGVTEAVGAVVMMIAGGNAKQVVSRVKERIAEINAKGMLPGGLKIVSFYDRSELVDAALWTVTKVLLEGITLVIVILFLFLGDLRSSLIVIATLVLTPLMTFMVMNRVGLSANLMSLGGLAIAIGLLVDGSVVVVENAFAHLGRSKEEAEGRIRILFRAVQEVATPVVFGVGVIILVFLPLMTQQGMEGKMFSPLAFTIAIALSISLVLSLTLTPALASYLLTGGAEHDTWLVGFVRRRYNPLLAFALAHPRKTVLTAAGAFALALGLVPFLGTSFVPEMKEGSLVPNINRAPAISLQESLKLETQALKLILEVPGVKGVVTSIGRGESPADPQAQNESSPIVTLLPRDQWPEGWAQDTIADVMREKLRAVPGVQIVMAQPISDRVDELLTGVRSDVAVKIFGDEIAQLKGLGDAIARVAGRIQGARDIRVEFLTGQQYLAIEIDRRAIARYGINVADVQELIEAAVGGKKATDVYEGERRFAGIVRLPERYRHDAEAIRMLLLPTPSGSMVNLESVAKVHVVEGPAEIKRENAKRRLVVGVNVKDRDLGGFVAELQRSVEAQVKLPEGWFLEWGGQFENMERALSHLAFIVPVTIGAIFFLLFVLFRSLRLATLIIMVLPFASIGGVFGLFFTGEYLSVPASVGFIALWGIAVLNGVVLVSYIRALRQEGHPRAEAIREGAMMRLRPVLMTATVAMLGLVPFLFATGPGSEVQRPLAVVVIGGLFTSTLLTLVVLPAMYGWFDEEAQEV
jgi:cobalt-zinc-cadmium resistance protein CzcA